jgi:hypothetical protein
MITKLFLLQLFLTFVAGSTWIFLTVLSGLRFGSKISGFIGGLPSTALISFFFIGFTQSPEIASRATAVFPLAIGISGIFLVVYAWLIRRGFLAALTFSLLSWFILSSAVAWFHPVHFYINLFIYAITMFLAYLILEKRLFIRSVPAAVSRQQGKDIIFRAVFGGLVITGAVLIAKTGGPVLGGIFTAFPAMFISTLAITNKVQGPEFSRALTKPLLVTGVITIAVYAIAMKYLYLSVGLYAGTLLSIGISSISAYFTYRFILPAIR